MSTIPFDHPILVRAREIIPPDLHAQTFVAGSAAIQWPEAFEKGGDVDVYVVGLTPARRDELSSSIQTAQAAQTPPVWVTAGEGAAEWYPPNDLVTIAYSHERLQIMLSAEPNIQAVVEGFDISLHAYAVGPLTAHYPLLIGASGSSRFTIYPRTWRSARRTFKRLCRFSLRYDDWDWIADRRPETVRLLTEVCGLDILKLPEGL